MFTARAWAGYMRWHDQGAAELGKLHTLISESTRTPFDGTGKPEPLRGSGQYKGYWSRRISKEHRLVYRVTGKDDDQTLEIVQCRFHYGG